MSVLSEHCLESLFSRSGEDGEGALRFLCLHSGQDELCRCQILRLTTSHRSQSRHVKHLDGYLATWQIHQQGDLELTGCNFGFSQNLCIGIRSTASMWRPPKRNSKCLRVCWVVHGSHSVVSLYTTFLFCSVLFLKKLLPIYPSNTEMQYHKM